MATGLEQSSLIASNSGSDKQSTTGNNKKKADKGSTDSILGKLESMENSLNAQIKKISDRVGQLEQDYVETPPPKRWTSESSSHWADGRSWELAEDLQWPVSDGEEEPR
uniref:Uncharacterized protein n=1 Tax=Amphimedon queenslandica TaxID=400682 RepID=A0A1X7UUK1_AMPQE